MKDIIDRINYLVVNFCEGNNSKFAELVGTSEANVRNYRLKTVPKADILINIANQFEINYEWLFTGKGSMLKDNEIYTLKGESKEKDKFRSQLVVGDGNIATVGYNVGNNKIDINTQNSPNFQMLTSENENLKNQLAEKERLLAEANRLLAEKEKLLIEKERTIQILFKQIGE